MTITKIIPQMRVFSLPLIVINAVTAIRVSLFNPAHTGRAEACEDWYKV